MMPISIIGFVRKEERRERERKKKTHINFFLS